MNTQIEKVVELDVNYSPLDTAEYNKKLVFVYDSIIRSYYNSHASGPYLYDDYCESMRNLITELLGRENVCLIFAVSKTNPNLIAGYILGEIREDENTVVIHYVYVKKDFRTKGLATYLVNFVKSLLPDSDVYHTFRTSLSRFLKLGKFKITYSRYANKKCMTNY